MADDKPRTVYDQTLGGFIHPLDWSAYSEAFVTEFSTLRCRHDSSQLVCYWRFDGNRVSLDKQVRVACWHAGYRAALRACQPTSY